MRAMVEAKAIADRVYYSQIAQIPDLVWHVYFEPLPRLFTDHSAERGGNVMGLDRTQDNFIIEFNFNLFRMNLS